VPLTPGPHSRAHAHRPRSRWWSSRRATPSGARTRRPSSTAACGRRRARAGTTTKRTRPSTPRATTRPARMAGARVRVSVCVCVHVCVCMCVCACVCVCHGLVLGCRPCSRAHGEARPCTSMHAAWQPPTCHTHTHTHTHAHAPLRHLPHHREGVAVRLHRAPLPGVLLQGRGGPGDQRGRRHGRGGVHHARCARGLCGRRGASPAFITTMPAT
jgi:hypothetical protein